MEIIDYLRKIFLSLVLACNIVKAYAVGGGDIYLCIALSHTESHSIWTACLRHKLPAHILTKPCENKYGQDNREESAEQGRHSFLDILGKYCISVIKALSEGGVVHLACFVYLSVVLVGENNF